MKKIFLSILIGLTLISCGEKKVIEGNNEKKLTLDELIVAAKQEGQINSVGMPDSWANWKETWEDINEIYGLDHVDTDMSSAQEVAKFKAEKEQASADIGDVGFEFGGIARAEGVTQSYKPTTWDEIPEWAKDKDGHWALAYTGTIAFIVNKDLVDEIPRSWKDLREGKQRVSIGNVGSATQANAALLAASIAMGGSEGNIEPGYNYFKEIAKDKRLALNDPSIANLEKGEVEVGLLWDFNALSYRDLLDKDKFEVLIPQDGSFISGYTTIINRYAKHPNAAKLAREYIFSDKGQINLARGYAKPIRDIKLPEDVKSMLLPNEQYKNVKPIKDFGVWAKTAGEIPLKWQEEVLYFRR
ncbi:ABC transporter substrate-binding protein [Psychrilyobacter atlanticus]|uniref:ABC transporter substrate-binding protein n=1 Tax=Psychrilyobacter atlanticus TaxID=271091 RepID=UPI00041A1928|nr:extracellular solute-binding protein [Psychrilyobacter atlanticus]